jgi:hypothetical protein
VSAPDRLAFLLGTWRGTGRGDYPTIDAFEYREEVVFASVPTKPFVTYAQRTTDPGGAPLHAEAGYLRSPTEATAELVIAQPTGVAEVHVGTLDGTTLDLASTGVLLTPTAKEVRAVARRLEVSGDVLRYELDMAAVGQDLQFHLEAELTKVGTEY